MPASRISAASHTAATPKQCTPASRAVRITRTAPWPYASAFTAIQIFTPGAIRSRNSRMFFPRVSR